jgi:hypothetical protein
MRRRDFILAGSAIVTWPFAAAGQEPGRTYHLGGVAISPRTAPYWLAMLNELRRFGFIEGQNLTVDWRAFGPNIDLIPEFISEVVKAKVDVLYATGDLANSRGTAGDDSDSNRRVDGGYGRVGTGALAGAPGRQYDRHDYPRDRA